MARTAEGKRLTELHRQAQLQVRARSLRDFTHIWPIWQGDGPSFGRLVTATVPLVQAYNTVSSSISSGYFDAFRRAERIAGATAPQPADPLDVDTVRGTLYLTGLEMTRKAILAGQSPQAAMRTALVRTSGTTTRFVLAGGRETIVRSSDSDQRAQGWARVTSGGCCAFCAMLASRGPAYGESGVDFEAHDHCGCTGEPYYEGSEWPGRGREFRDLWDEHAKGDNPLQEFRKALGNRRRS